MSSSCWRHRRSWLQEVRSTATSRPLPSIVERSGPQGQSVRVSERHCCGCGSVLPRLRIRRKGSVSALFYLVLPGFTWFWHRLACVLRGRLPRYLFSAPREPPQEGLQELTGEDFSQVVQDPKARLNQLDMALLDGRSRSWSSSSVLWRHLQWFSIHFNRVFHCEVRTARLAGSSTQLTDRQRCTRF